MGPCHAILSRKFIPICSMYGIFTYIWVILRENVGKYSIHGAYGMCLCIYDSLVGGRPIPLNNMSSSVGLMKFPIYGKIKKFQSTNQYVSNTTSHKINATAIHPPQVRILLVPVAWWSYEMLSAEVNPEPCATFRRWGISTCHPRTEALLACLASWPPGAGRLFQDCLFRVCLKVG